MTLRTIVGRTAIISMQPIPKNSRQSRLIRPIRVQTGSNYTGRESRANSTLPRHPSPHRPHEPLRIFSPERVRHALVIDLGAPKDLVLAPVFPVEDDLLSL